MRRFGLRDERGLSVVEMVVASAVMAIVVGIFGSVLASTFGATATVERQTQAQDQIRTVLARIERDVRSADCMHAPTMGGTAGQPGSTADTLTFETHAGATWKKVTYAVGGGGDVTRTETDMFTGATQSGVIGHQFTDAASSFAYVAPAAAYVSPPATGSPAHGSIVVRLAVQPESGTERAVEVSITGRNQLGPCP